MTFTEIMEQLEQWGSEQTKKVLVKHGAREPFFGVKVADLKKIVKKVKKDYELSLKLYNSGNSDAMYLAGLIANEKKMTKENLQDWAEKAYWYMLSDFTVPWVASESNYGWELAAEWIESDTELIASAGWSTYSSMAAQYQDEELDIDKYAELLDRVASNIHGERNRVRMAMNQFVIATGSSIAPLLVKAKDIATQIGKVKVDMGGTSCKVPFAPEYIQKLENKGYIGKKRKTARS